MNTNTDNKVALSIMTIRIMTLRRMPFSIMTLRIKGLLERLSIDVVIEMKLKSRSGLESH